MSTVQAVTMIAVALLGALVVFVNDPLRQAITLGVYGLSLTVMFFALQAPDVALSEIVVSTVGLPVIALAALRKIRRHERASQADKAEEEGS